MGLKHQDLRDTVLSRISIDEYEPKTGDSSDVVVVGFRVIDQLPGKDLYSFINSSTIDVRDVETSPNPDLENNYWVFVELDREPGCLDKIRELVKDIEQVSGPLKWQAKTHLTDDHHALGGADIEQFVIQEPDNYMNRADYEASLQEQDAEQDTETAGETDSTELSVGDQVVITGGPVREFLPTDTGVIMGFETQGDTQYALLNLDDSDETVPVETEFLQLANSEKQLPEQDILTFLINSNARVDQITEGVLTLRDRTNTAELRIVAYGPEQQVLPAHGLHETALNHGDSRMGALNAMLGEARAVWIGDHIVVYHINRTHVLVTKPV